MDIDEDEAHPDPAPLSSSDDEGYQMLREQWRVFDAAAARLADEPPELAAQNQPRRQRKLWQRMRDENGHLPRMRRLPAPAPSKQGKADDVSIKRPSALAGNDRALCVGPRSWWDEKEL